MIYLLLAAFLPCYAHVPLSSDTLQSDPVINELEPVEIRAYFVPQPSLRSTVSSVLIDRQRLQAYSRADLLPAFNSVPGVRMEERSPGSYRLSIRGSLLRSPYGVRNVKVYLDDMPFTDAGGNTYLQILDPGLLRGVEILKGPDGSVFGANSGGVVVFRSGPATEINVQGGSYGLLHQQAHYSSTPNDRYEGTWSQSFQHSDGYREHSALRKFTLHTRHRWQYLADQPNEIRFQALFGDLDYQTPGGLTEAQWRDNPRAARPATATLPSAVSQGAGIRNRTWLAGVTHAWPISSALEHVLTLFGSYTDFTNPFITNYEQRFESNAGIRTYFSFRRSLADSEWSYQTQVGLEWQQGDYRIHNFDNEGGHAAAPQAKDRMKPRNGTAFIRMAWEHGEDWLIEGSLSRNNFGYRFQNLHPFMDEDFTPYEGKPAWMPRVAVSHHFRPGMLWRALVSKGFSPPTTAEIRPADMKVNTALKPELGWNYEVGWRYHSPLRSFTVDASLFNYRMQDALVRRSRDNGAEYFINAGRVNQQGLELASSAWIEWQPVKSSQTHSASGRLAWTGSWAWSHFQFDTYQVSGKDYAGNALTGVPRHTLSNSLELTWGQGLRIGVYHQYVSSIPLNDANADWADAYHILQAKVQWNWNGPLRLQFFAGADNLLNQSYSLGYDINAFGGRYYNAAPLRSIYGGIAWSL